MSRKEVVVSNVSKEHDNPIAELVQVACRYDSEIILESNNRRINAKSIMGIMAFNPSKGMTVNIVAEGSDEEEALAAMGILYGNRNCSKKLCNLSRKNKSGLGS